MAGYKFSFVISVPFSVLPTYPGKQVNTPYYDLCQTYDSLTFAIMKGTQFHVFFFLICHNNVQESTNKISVSLHDFCSIYDAKIV